jgi:hypothetical protein
MLLVLPLEYLGYVVMFGVDAGKARPHAAETSSGEERAKCCLSCLEEETARRLNCSAPVMWSRGVKHDEQST